MTMTTADIQAAARQVVARLSGARIEPEQITPGMQINSDLGIDSLRFIRLILEIESLAARKIFSLETIAQIKTVGDLDQVLAR